MIYFFLTIFGTVILVLALKNGRDNGYPYLGDVDLEEENDND
jgi:hypothetical protein